VARVIFMRRNPGAAKDGSVKVFIVARAIFERRKPKQAYCCAAIRTRARPRTRPKPSTSTHACRHNPLPAPNCPRHHAPQGFFINSFFIAVQGAEKKVCCGARRPGREPPPLHSCPLVTHEGRARERRGAGRCGGCATGRGAGLGLRGPGGARPPRHATTAAAPSLCSSR